ncbi:unnamed protein product [Coffea canephora]|uniref:DH200=94 genomic scaffold, scaffold_710 n=1 Tax=Coffea canephora TaxID=49390 RepID=A0A068VGV4_COFCA|nr:unnamed protein product [Coffea canephora]
MGFEVKFIRKTVVKAIGPLPDSHILTLSNLDLLSGRFPVTYFYFYNKPQDHIPTPFHALKDSLAKCLSLFYPFAGKIVQNSQTNEPEIICDNSGALLVEAKANIPLKELDFYNLDKSLQGKLVTIHQDFPLQIQVTNYTCGNLSMTFTFDHALGDASAFGRFLLTWSEIATSKSLSGSPDHSRDLIQARSPPTYDPSLDETFISCTLQDIANIPTGNKVLKRLYYVDVKSIDSLQTLASLDSEERTKIEAFSAYVWKIMVRAINKNHEKCKMGWLVDGRTRLGKDRNSMSNYIGNVISVAFGDGDVHGLKQASLAETATLVHDSISKVTNQAHFLDLIDWIECHRPGLMLSKIVLGLGGPAIVVSSGRRFPVSEIDIGFGNPILGTVCSTIEKIGVGYINQRPSAKGDGSWIVSVILWPEMIAALESDPNQVFQPMNAKFLQL